MKIYLKDVYGQYGRLSWYRRKSAYSKPMETLDKEYNNLQTHTHTELRMEKVGNSLVPEMKLVVRDLE